MIYIVPNHDNFIANHFIKAKQFGVIDQQNQQVMKIDNPAAGALSSCKDKSTAISMLTEIEADAVVVRNIGQRSLGKLLTAGLRVFKVSGKTSVFELASASLTELTDASEGRRSLNHEKKGGCSHQEGSRCCGDAAGHDHTHGHKGKCCESTHQHHLVQRGTIKPCSHQEKPLTKMAPVSSLRRG